MERMPTAARVVAALTLGAVSALMVFVLIAAYPEEPWANNRSELVRLFGVVGLLVGWFSLGRRVAREGGTGIALGIRAALTVAAWCVFLLAANFLWRQILRGQLAGDEPIEALIVLGSKAVEYIAFLVHPRVIAFGLGLGILVGILVRRTQRVWK